MTLSFFLFSAFLLGPAAAAFLGGILAVAREELKDFNNNTDNTVSVRGNVDRNSFS